MPGTRKLGANLDANSVAKLLNLPTPTSPGDAAPKSYVDAVKAALDWKASVRAASTANVNIASAPATIDGVNLAAADRVLLKNQTTGAENGIYVWNGAASAMTRAADADASDEVTPGASVPVEEGTVNTDTIWLLTTNGPIVLGTDALSFTQLGTIITAGAGLVKNGQALELDIPVTVARGGTGSTTAAGARSNLAATTKYAANITGDAAATTFNVTHNLASTDVVVAVYEAATDDEVEIDVHRTDANTVRIGFASAPANAVVYRVVVIG